MGDDHEAKVRDFIVATGEWAASISEPSDAVVVAAHDTLAAFEALVREGATRERRLRAGRDWWRARYLVDVAPDAGTVARLDLEAEGETW